MSTTKKVKIIVPGSSNADLTGFAPHLPAAGETVMGSSLHIGIGGKGCNQMTAAARSGAKHTKKLVKNPRFVQSIPHSFPFVHPHLFPAFRQSSRAGLLYANLRRDTLWTVNRCAIIKN